MKIGSKEHKAQFFQDLLKTYQENIWKDEMYLSRLEDLKGDKRTEIASLTLKLDNKEFKTANEGKKAIFIAERELEHLDKEIAQITAKTKELWPERIESVKRYMEKDA